ncbi:ComF family protein [Pseudoflavonifractor sp. P01025]|uniref:ComF family protein n=1 Tax=Flintibacter porci TaxID=3342383 RepID=UPI001F42FD91|nr:phosphoribosyltransferase family protein [Pseudoflavonifractor phocaeensis]MCF2675001.1 ComF family protein [Pseudoflavonifractor phocaeensis]
MMWSDWALDLLFPPKCPYCQELLEGSYVPACTRCQPVLPWLVGTQGERKVDFTAGCLSPLAYRDKVVDSIHRFKFSGRASYARAYAILVAQCVRDHWDKPLDAVTWTPLSRQRRRERGYDQAQLLAKWVARELELPVLGMLDKVRDIPPQSGIQDDARRRANVLGAYRLRKDARPEGMNLLLVDDVVTSGSTLSECARLLSGAGAETVVCATLAQARKN